MKSFLNPILIVSVALAFVALAVFFPNLAKADFQVAYTGSVEEKPAVAYNSQTGKFLVAYLEHDPRWGLELRCQLHNADGSKSGGVLMPFYTYGLHNALDKPAIAYSPNSNKFYVAMVESEGFENAPIVHGVFLNGDGTVAGVSHILFHEGTIPHSPFETGDGVNSLNVVHNSILDEFFVTVQQFLSYGIHFPTFNVIRARRVKYPSGPIAGAPELYNWGTGGEVFSHSIAYAPIANTSPAGGRYLLAAIGHSSGHLTAVLLDSSGYSIITEVPLQMGLPEGNYAHPDIAYGEVEGQKRFLLVYSDQDNCTPGYSPCDNVPPEELWKQWSGVWGTYVDPEKTSYPDTANNTPFPISFIWSHIANKYEYKPRVSYNPSAQAFCVAWRELPVYNANNDESRSHIRGNTVDYFVDDGLYDTTLVPLPNSNVVISDVTGTCRPGSTCLSNEDPTFPDISASYGSSAVVVWHQKYPPDTTPPIDLDVFGDFFSAGAGPDYGTDTIGVRRVNEFLLKNSNSSGWQADIIPFGVASDTPVIGDWDGDGDDTIGVRRSGMWYLRNSNSSGSPDISFGYGLPSDVPVVGDWNGDGIDTIGVRRSGMWYLKNSNSSGSPDMAFAFGLPSDMPVVGDWNGDGIDTIGVRRSGMWYLRNSNSSGAPNISFAFGLPTDTPVVGDWNGDGIDTIGVRRSGVWYLRNSNSSGAPDMSFAFGLPTDVPLVGDWDGE